MGPEDRMGYIRSDITFAGHLARIVDSLHIRAAAWWVWKVPHLARTVDKALEFPFRYSSHPHHIPGIIDSTCVSNATGDGQLFYLSLDPHNRLGTCLLWMIRVEGAGDADNDAGSVDRRGFANVVAGQHAQITRFAV